jgi:DNA-binding NarL/FixJ family response regulator
MRGNAATAALEFASRQAPLSIAVVVTDAGLGQTLRAALDRNEIGHVIEARTVRELAANVSARDLDAIVLRTGNSPREVLEAYKSARTAFPNTPIVGLWPEEHRRQDQRALKSGIDGLLEESRVGDALVPTIRAVCSGLVCFPRRTPVSGRGDSLSSREKQVLGMLIMGFTNAEIARRLYLAESTVKSHLSSAYLKLGVRSRKDAAALILDPDEGLGTAILAISGA